MRQLLHLIALLWTATGAFLPQLAVPPSARAQQPTNVQDFAPVLLSLDDIGPGWLPSYPGEQGAYTTTRCGQDLTAMYPTIAHQFKRSDLGPVLLHEIVVVPPGEGAAAMAVQRDRLAACPRWVTTQAGRPTLTWQGSQVPFPDLTEDVLAVRSVAPMILVGQTTGDQVFMRTGDVFNLIGYASVGTPDPAALETYARLAAARLQGVLSGGPF